MSTHPKRTIIPTKNFSKEPQNNKKLIYVFWIRKTESYYGFDSNATQLNYISDADKSNQGYLELRDGQPA